MSSLLGAMRMTSRTTAGMGMDEGGNDGLMHSDGVAR